MMMKARITHGRPMHQHGLTLIEFMVAIVLGMIMVAAVATLIANQSANRGEVDRAGKMIENGRYALQAMMEDVQLAGYWGEMGTAPAVPGVLPKPCSTTVLDAGADLGNLRTAMGLHVQGYDALATLPSELSCVTNFKPGTDVLVVRRVDPDTSAIETAGVVVWNKLTVGQVYVQTGVNSATGNFDWRISAADGSTDATTFNLTRRDLATPASPRRYVVHIYYIARCSVCTGGSADTIPTLKRVDLDAAAGATVMNSPITIAEGVENLQFDFGKDADGDGAADGVDTTGGAFSIADWSNVVSAKLYALVRSSEKSPGYNDTTVGKTYAMGAAGAVSAAAGDEAYRRHVFVQSVRIVNPSSRRAP